MQRLAKLRKEDELYSNPKTKMFGMLLRAKRKKEEAAAGDDEQLAKRQDFCMLYAINKL